ncbi:MAG: hypothetical protein ABI573_12655 [Chloroflexota bacterium]
MTATRRRTVAFGFALLTYVLLLLGSLAILSGGGVTGVVPRALVALLPVPAAVGVVALSVDQFRANDELQQRIQLNALVVAFLGTLVTTFSWGFLEGVGVERLSGFVVFGMLVVLYVAALGLARRSYR